jgi:hypothetical protein
MLSNPNDGVLPPGMRAAQIVWMYEQLASNGSWQDCRRFIAKTGAYEALGIQQGGKIEEQKIPVR